MLPGPWWPTLFPALMGGSRLLLELPRPRPVGLVLGIVLLALAAVQLRLRNTVLNEDGVRPQGWLRCIPWTRVEDVERGRMALHYGDVVLRVAGRDGPVVLKERRGGQDLALVHRRWVRATGRNASDHPAAEPAPDVPG